MSNLDARPAEEVCERGDARVHVLPARNVPLGGPRAMRVRRTLPQRARSLIGAWCFCDHYGPDDVATSGGMHVPPHPHVGLQTVTWLFAGRVEHRDSIGSARVVRPGELSLMTAGRGISHSERTPPGMRAPVLHGVQLWVALPADQLDANPAFEHHADLPAVETDRWRVQVFLGALDIAGRELRSPATAYTPILGAQIDIAPGASLTVPVDQRFEHGVLVDTGPAMVEGRQIAPNAMAYVPPGARELTLTAGPGTPARLLVLGGVPLGERIVMWWNFVGRSHADVAAARADWQRQLLVPAADGPGNSADGPGTAVPGIRYADDAATGRFGVVSGYPGGPLPAPTLPGVRLRPRD